MISIIIPVYNQDKKLAKCLTSILEQSFRDFEIIIVNDGSSDQTAEVIAEFSAKCAKAGIKYLAFEQENRGAPAARNRGRAAASGDFLFFCDADEVLNKSCLEKMINALKGNAAVGFVFSSFRWGNKFFRVGPFSVKKLQEAPSIHTSSLIRAENFPPSGWDENLKRFQDWDLWLTIAEQGGQGIWIPESLFRIHPAGGTMSSWLPSRVYKLFPFLKTVKKYEAAVKIIKEKHGLIF
ncbi:MAG TPA: glycosyltransferase family A protein [Candidatus Methylomirabilis sp.]|nr:glycosyltransferase family A protein [Candidatus Methylomirabilis sp.]